MSEKRGFIYVLKNEAMPGLIKIGITQRKEIKKRLYELYNTGVPLPFECLWAGEVDDCKRIESVVHNAFLDQRINIKREFFAISPDRVIPLLSELSTKELTTKLGEVLNHDVSKEERDAVGAYRKRRPNLNFDEMGISAGSELIYINDCERKAEVISSQKVLYNNREFSLTALTKELLQLSYNVSPCQYWLYNGKNLDAIYEETYPRTEE